MTNSTTQQNRKYDKTYSIITAENNTKDDNTTVTQKEVLLQALQSIEKQKIEQLKKSQELQDKLKIDDNNLEELKKNYLSLKLGLDPSYHMMKINPFLGMLTSQIYYTTALYPAKYGKIESSPLTSILSNFGISPELLQVGILSHYFLQKSPDVLKGVYEREKSRQIMKQYGGIGSAIEHAYQANRILTDFMKLMYIPAIQTGAIGLALKTLPFLGNIIPGGNILFNPITNTLLSGLGSLSITTSSLLGKIFNPFNFIFPAIGHLTGAAKLGSYLSAPLLSSNIPALTFLGNILANPAYMGLGAFIGFSMAIGLSRSLAMRKYRPKNIDAYEIEQKTAASYQMQPYLMQLINMKKNINPIDVMQTQILMLIEQHTSIIPLLYNLLHTKFSEKQYESNLLTEGITGYNRILQPEEIKWYEKPQKYMEAIRSLLDPFAIITNYLTTKKGPREFIKDVIFGFEKEKSIREKVSQVLGIQYSTASLLGTTSQRLLNKATTYEGKVLTLLSAIFDVLRSQLSELITIRKGLGFDKSLDTGELFEALDFEKRSLIGGFFEELISLPVKLIKGGAKLTKYAYQNSEKIVENTSNVINTTIEKIKDNFSQVKEKGAIIYTKDKLKNLFTEKLSELSKYNRNIAKKYFTSIYNILKDTTSGLDKDIELQIEQLSQINTQVDILNKIYKTVYDIYELLLYGRDLHLKKKIRIKTLKPEIKVVPKESKFDKIKSIATKVKNIPISKILKPVKATTKEIYDIHKELYGETIKNFTTQIKTILTMILTNIPKFAKGGEVKGKDDGKDKILALLRPGEYVLSHEHLKKLGKYFVEHHINTVTSIKNILKEKKIELQQQKEWRYKEKLLSYIEIIASILQKIYKFFTQFKKPEQVKESLDSIFGLLGGGLLLGKKLFTKISLPIQEKLIKPIMSFIIGKIIPQSIKDIVSSVFTKIGSIFSEGLIGKILSKTVVSDLLGKLIGKAVPMGIGSAIAEYFFGSGDVKEAIFAGIGGLAGGAIGTLISPGIGTFFGSILGSEIGKIILPYIWDAITNSVNKITDFIGSIYDKFKEILHKTKKKIENISNNKVIKTLINSIKSIFEGVKNILIAPFEIIIKVINGLKEIAKYILDKLSIIEKIPGVGNIVKKIKSDLVKINEIDTSKTQIDKTREIQKAQSIYTVESITEKIKHSEIYKTGVSLYEKFRNMLHERLKKDKTETAVDTINSKQLLDRILERQIYVESAGNVYAQSKVGAKGLAQFMPATWKHIWTHKQFFAKYNPNLLKYKGIPNIYDVQAQKDAQKAYMKYLLDKFHGDIKWALAAYNWGEGRAKRLYERTKGVFEKAYRYLPQETKQYIKKIIGYVEYQSGVTNTIQTQTKNMLNKIKNIYETSALPKVEEQQITSQQITNIQSQQIPATQQPVELAMSNTFKIIDTRTMKLIDQLFDTNLSTFEQYMYYTVFDSGV